MAACPACGAENARAARFCSTCGSKLEPAGAARETRKTVTVLFADVTGSTALGEQLDPESLRALMTRYFADMKAIIERHGGNVEKFIGDAVMAVFGIPTVHEDDALRAVRAAAEIRDRLAELNAELTATRGLAIRFRTGVNTGEVVAGDPATGQTLVTGDTVNTAARLEQAAPPGEILLGKLTYNLVRDAVEVEPVEPISAKGKAEPVPAYRLVSVAAAGAGHARQLDRPLVGRAAELAVVRAAFDLAVSERSPRLVTILGIAGVGKSRLVAELLAGIDAEATVLKGRCLPYGEGITYWPIREIVHGAAGIVEGDSRDDARAKVRALLEGAPDADVVGARVGVALGLETEGAPQEEIFWAIRKLFEHLARERPLVALVEDVHWAEPTLLDLLEYVVDLAVDVPLLLVCPARPELVEARPGWGGARASSTLMHLEPLAGPATETLIDSLPGGVALPDTLRTRILAAAEGNPLYLEEMLAMLVDEGYLVERDDSWQTTGDLAELEVPQSVRALLAARIEALPEPERRVAERASVVGRVFEAAAIRELGDEIRGEINPSLVALVRKELLQPERSELSVGDAFKFRHVLIRDAAYEALPKAQRADLHERFAGWLERAAGERVAEYAEILGYHLEQAHRYLIELGESETRISLRAANWLERSADQAWERGDVAACDSLYQRAAGVSHDARERVRLLETRLCSIAFRGHEVRSLSAATALRTEADGLADETTMLRARVWEAAAQYLVMPGAGTELQSLVAFARPRLLAAQDQLGAAVCDLALVPPTVFRLRWDDAHAAAERAAGLTAISTLAPLLNVALEWVIFTSLWSSLPLGQVRDRLRRLASEASTAWPAHSSAYFQASILILERGYSPAAPEIARYLELVSAGRGDQLASVYVLWARLALVAGDAVSAAALAQEAHAASGSDNQRQTAAAFAAEACAILGLWRQSEQFASEAEEVDAADLQVRASALRTRVRRALHRGDLDLAARLAGEVMALVEPTQASDEKADALIIAAQVEAASGRTDPARELLGRARDLMSQKGAAAAIERIDREYAAL